jgi:gas vesicle protein
MSSGKALLGVLAGIATGALLGVLFAPAKGSNTRKNISRKTEDLMDAMNDKIEEKVNEVMHTVTGKVKKAKSQFNEAVESAKAEMVD